MLEYLHIRDLALISDMELEFASGMNVLTGETGAGKSFILKALNFLMGERLGADMVRPGKERAQVEALFMRSGEELIVRRELIAETGRSRLFINDTLASQETIKELRTTLLVHTSQHGQQKLLQPNFQAKLIDDCGLRGLTVGGAQVSEKHAGFVVNLGGGSKDFSGIIKMLDDSWKSPAQE